MLDLAGQNGARVVVLRRGERGVLAAAAGDRERREAWAVPAVEDTRVVDVTGCGNAFCGGFLATHVHNVRIMWQPCLYHPDASR